MTLTTVAATVLAAGLSLSGSSAAAPAGPPPAASAPASASAPPAARRPELTEEQWRHRLELACGRVRLQIDRARLAQQRIGSDAGIRGSTSRLQRRADRLRSAGRPELAELVRVRITMRRQAAELLPQRLAALESGREVCSKAGA